MTARDPRYAPEFSIAIRGSVVPTALRASITSVRLTTGMDGADRVELSVFNERLRWLDNDLLKPGNPLSLSMGYTSSPLEQLFVGEIVGIQASFPSGGTPTLQVNAQDKMARLQKGKRSRWFQREVPFVTNVPIPRTELVSRVTAEHGLSARFDPAADLEKLVGSLTAVLIEAFGGADPSVPQRGVDRQIDTNDHDLLKRIAREMGFDLLVQHTGPEAGSVLIFFAPWRHLDSEVQLTYGRSLLDFSPRESDVGQVASVTANVWGPSHRFGLAITLGWDWERSALTLSVEPGKTKPASADGQLVIEQPLTAGTAPRRLVKELFPKLNNRLTGTASAVGDPRLRPGSVVQIDGVGVRFGGFYRVTSATHTIDSGGYRTQLELRKEIWFTLPKALQGALPVKLPDVAGIVGRLR